MRTYYRVQFMKSAPPWNTETALEFPSQKTARAIAEYAFKGGTYRAVRVQRMTEEADLLLEDKANPLETADLFRRASPEEPWAMVDSGIPNLPDSINAAILLQGPGTYHVQYLRAGLVFDTCVKRSEEEPARECPCGNTAGIEPDSQCPDCGFLAEE